VAGGRCLPGRPAELLAAGCTGCPRGQRREPLWPARRVDVSRASLRLW